MSYGTCTISLCGPCRARDQPHTSIGTQLLETTAEDQTAMVWNLATGRCMWDDADESKAQVMKSRTILSDADASDKLANLIKSAHGNALRAASAGGCEKAVRLLLDKGIDIMAHGRNTSALQAA